MQPTPPSRSLPPDRSEQRISRDRITPDLVGFVHQQSARRAQRQVGVSDAILKERRIHHRCRCIETFLVGGRQRHDLPQRALCDADSNCRDVQREVCEMCGVQRSGNRGLPHEDVDTVRGCHAKILHRDIMAAGSAQTAHRPRIEYLHRTGRKQHRADFGGPREKTRPRFSIFGYNAVADEPIAMLASARESPSPVDDVLITTQLRGSARGETSAAMTSGPAA